MSNRLAIAISGAVSLGSYEAGVVYEIIQALAQHNQNNKDKPERQIFIDVLSGASAGGMTAAMIAQKLLFDGDALNGPYQNVMYDAWVKQVGIEDLLSNRYGDDPAHSLLSSNFVERIAEQVLVTPLSESDFPRKQHPACNGNVMLGLAMSNLNGVDYAVDAFKNATLEDETGQFVQTRFQDSFTRPLSRQTDNITLWTEIKNAARGCGAFPVAFAPIKIERNYKEPDYFGKARAFAQTAFSYVDGGTFNNYPLGTAKGLVNTVDTHPRDYESRYYLYISPNSKESTRSDFDADRASIFKTSGAITGAVFNQARFQDWILTSRYNNLVEEFDTRAKALAEHMLNEPGTDISALDNACELLLDKIFATTNASRDHEYAVLKEQFSNTEPANELRVGLGERAYHTWLKALHVLEASGRLHSKDHMPIYTITANNDELASDGMFAFIGFLEERLREHDYNLGRKKAREFLLKLQHINHTEKGVAEHHLPLMDFSFDDEIPALEDLGNVHIRDIKTSVREQLYHHSNQRVKLWLKQAGMNSVLRFLLMLYLKKQVKKFLHLN